MNPLRVLMVNKFLYPRGGAEIAMLDLAQRLEQAGASCLFYAMRDDRNPPSPGSPHFPSPVDFEHPTGLREPLRAGARMLYSTSARRGLARMLRGRRVDVAHLHNIYHQLSPSVIAPLRSAGIPVVMTAHDYKLVCPVHTLLSQGSVCTRCVGGHHRHAVLRRCNRGSLAASAMVAVESRLHRALRLYLDGIDAYIAPSRYVERMLIAGGYPADRIRVIPNFTEVANPPTRPPGDSILYAGRLAAEKGLDVLFQAAGGTGVELRIAGEGPERERLERSAAARRVHAVFLGRLDRPQLAREFARSRAVVLPSVWPENAPLVVLEAMGQARAVIASSVGGIPELVDDRVTGLLVPPSDPRALRAAVLRLIADAAGARSMGESGRQRAQAAFSPQLHVQRVLDLYERLAARPASAAA